MIKDDLVVRDECGKTQNIRVRKAYLVFFIQAAISITTCSRTLPDF